MMDGVVYRHRCVSIDRDSVKNGLKGYF